MLVPNRDRLQPDILAALERRLGEGVDLEQDCFWPLLVWLKTRLNILFNEYKSTVSFRVLLETVKDNERINFNMYTYAMIR